MVPPRCRSPAPGPVRRLQWQTRFQLRPAVPGRRSRLRSGHGCLTPNRSTLPTLLRDEEWSKWTDSEIARRCAVHQTTVMRHRHEISLMQSIGEPGLPRIYVNRHGAISIMNTAAIGARPAAPVASPAPKPEPPQAESVITAARSPEARPSVSPPTPPSAKAASRDVEASD